MNRLFFFYFAVACCGTGHLVAHAEDGAESDRFNWAVTLGWGESEDSIDIYRAGLQREFGLQWFRTKVGWLSGFHEASFGVWEKDGDSAQVVAYSPVFAYRFNLSIVEPYLEGGIGIAALSDTRITSRDLSSTLQFEDRIGGGVRLGRDGRHDLNFRFMHYSNASTARPNAGIDIYLGSYTFRF